MPMLKSRSKGLRERAGGSTAPALRTQQRAYDLSVSSLASIYSCCGLFDLCGDADLMSLSFEGASPFLDWIGWEGTDLCKIIRNFIAWQRPAYANGNPTSAVLSDPCADPTGVDFGVCDFQLNDFARLRKSGPVRDMTKTQLRLCETQPRYRLDGTPITDDDEFDMRLATEVLMQDFKRLVIDGNDSNAGEFDGLESLIKTGYTNINGESCQLMNSLVVDWNNNDLNGGAGITVNGGAISATANFVDVLLAVYRRVRQRISWAPILAAQNLTVGDMILVLPTDFIDCVLNAYTCWRVCPGEQYNEANLNTLEARRFRDGLQGGLYGAGQITLHGQVIPIMPYDWGLIKGPNHFDAYLLTGSVGAVKTIQGQYNNMRTVAARHPAKDATDGGRILTWLKEDHTCYERIVEMQPRLLAWAPWAQVRIQDVACATILDPLSIDPLSTSFFPQTSFTSAACP